MTTDSIYKKAIDQLNNALSDAKTFNEKKFDTCSLSTVNDNGQPSVRIITVYDVSDKGLFFLANKNSGKIIHINNNPQVGLCFYWKSINLQATIEGVVEAIDRKKSEALWARRDHHAKVTAWAFDLAEKQVNTSELEDYKRKTRDQFQESQLPLAKSWTGFLIKPVRIEFWQADWRKNKCRDCYTKVGGVWQESRL